MTPSSWRCWRPPTSCPEPPAGHTESGAARGGSPAPTTGLGGCGLLLGGCQEKALRVVLSVVVLGPPGHTPFRHPWFGSSVGCTLCACLELGWPQTAPQGWAVGCTSFPQLLAPSGGTPGPSSVVGCPGLTYQAPSVLWHPSIGVLGAAKLEISGRGVGGAPQTPHCKIIPHLPLLSAGQWDPPMVWEAWPYPLPCGGTFPCLAWPPFPVWGGLMAKSPSSAPVRNWCVWRDSCTVGVSVSALTPQGPWGLLPALVGRGKSLLGGGQLMSVISSQCHAPPASLPFCRGRGNPCLGVSGQITLKSQEGLCPARPPEPPFLRHPVSTLNRHPAPLPHLKLCSRYQALPTPRPSGVQTAASPIHTDYELSHGGVGGGLL